LRISPAWTALPCLSADGAGNETPYDVAGAMVLCCMLQLAAKALAKRQRVKTAKVLATCIVHPGN
jgi:hypothetical protein